MLERKEFIKTIINDQDGILDAESGQLMDVFAKNASVYD